MNQPFRTHRGGRIDRDTSVAFHYNGTELRGHVGDTLASALLANGIHTVTSSIKFGRARGIAAAGAEDPCGIVQVDAPFPDPMQLAATIELSPGLVAHGVPGQGKLAEADDLARYDSAHLQDRKSVV